VADVLKLYEELLDPTRRHAGAEARHGVEARSRMGRATDAARLKGD